MTAVKKEVAGLEAMKEKLKDMEKLKQRLADVQNRLQSTETANMEFQRKLDDSDRRCDQFRADMQHLNDIYTEEREKHLDTQQICIKQEQSLSNMQGELSFYQRDAQKYTETKKKYQTLRNQLNASQIQFEQEKAELEKQISSLEVLLKDADKTKKDLSEHIWNIAEESKQLKHQLETNGEIRLALEHTVQTANEKTKEVNEKLLMEHEDFIMLTIRRDEGDLTHHSTILALKVENERIVSAVSNKEEQVAILLSKIKTIEQNRLLEKTDVQKRITELTDSLQAASTKIEDMAKEVDEYRERQAESSAERAERLVEDADKAALIESLQAKIMVFEQQVLNY